MLPRLRAPVITAVITAVVAATALASPTAATVPSLEFDATFPNTPAKFNISVKPRFIETTKQKVSLTRFAVDVQQPDWTDGPPVHNASTVRDFWVNRYDWNQVQAELNQQFKQYTTTIAPKPNAIFTEPIRLHFVHHRSNRSDAIPLLFIHGWPGSFMEAGHIIESLTSPLNESAPAFHVVAPSIPGFGFSPAPTVPGFGARAAAEVFNALMTEKLNYPKYVVQAGDVGGFVLRFLAGNHPESVVSALSNFWLAPPTPGDKARYYAGKATPDEAYVIENYGSFENFSSGYRFIQQTQPLQLGIGMTDSPVGFAMWIYNYMHAGVQHYIWTAKDVITWTMMYWIQGPYSGMRFYKELVKDGVLEDGLDINATFPYVTQPVAISEFPFDFWYRTPLAWAQRGGNVLVRYTHDSGGHFAAFETPAILVDDIRTFFGNHSLANTGEFLG